MPDCECKTWATDDIGLDSVLGHHHGCRHAPNAVTALRGLIRDLTDGMDYWAQDCDGVHPRAWDAYRRAKLLCGQIVDDPANEKGEFSERSEASER